MSKYMIRASYTRQGLQGLIKEGGSSRRAAIEAAVASAGGELESMYYAFGDEDVLFIVELPDNASAAGLSLLISVGRGHFLPDHRAADAGGNRRSGEGGVELPGAGGLSGIEFSPPFLQQAQAGSNLPP